MEQSISRGYCTNLNQQPSYSVSVRRKSTLRTRIIISQRRYGIQNPLQTRIILININMFLEAIGHITSRSKQKSKIKIEGSAEKCSYNIIWKKWILDKNLKQKSMFISNLEIAYERSKNQLMEISKERIQKIKLVPRRQEIKLKESKRKTSSILKVKNNNKTKVIRKQKSWETFDSLFCQFIFCAIILLSKHLNVRYIRQMQIKINKPLAEINNLLLRNNLQPTPKRSSLINQYPKQHKENQLNVNNINRSPARSMSRKALVSRDDSTHSLTHNDPRNRAKSRRIDKEIFRTCQNHENIEGCFHINIEGGDLYYCEKCALKLKSQGFPIKRAFDGSHEQFNRRDNHHRPLLPAYSHFQGHPQFDTLKSLLSEIYESEAKMLGTQHKNVEQLFTRANMELQNFYDTLQEMVRNRREAGLAELQSLNQSFMMKFKGNEYEQASSEIKSMKRDIEENVESIIGQVQEETFAQCVESYQERLDALNRFAEQRSNQTDKLRQKLERTLEEEANYMQAEIMKIQTHTVSCSSQKVLTSQADEIDYVQQGQTRGPFRNLFNQEKEKPKKRLISRK